MVEYSVVLFNHWSTPLVDLDQVIRLREGIFLEASQTLIRIGGIRVDYLGHAHCSRFSSIKCIALTVHGARFAKNWKKGFS
jgi:hypothetical protein